MVSSANVISRSIRFRKCSVAFFVLTFLIPLAASKGDEQRGVMLSTVTSTILPVHASFVTAVDFNGDSIPDLLCYDSVYSRLTVLMGSGNGDFSKAIFLGKSQGVTDMAYGTLTRAGGKGIVLLHRETNEVEVILQVKKDSLVYTGSYLVNFYPEKILLADINNDGVPDILTYGKLSPGISVLLGNGDGTFQPSKILFPDIPVVDAKVVRLNDDKFPDMIIRNWLTNEVIFYFGMGDLQFSEQNRMSFNDDSTTVLTGDFNGDDVLDCAIISSRDRDIQFLEGNGMANYSAYQTVSCTSCTRSFSLAYLNGDLYPDIIAFAPKSGTFSVFGNRGNGEFQNETIFGCSNGASNVLVADFDHDGWNDVAVFDDQDGSVTYYWNSRKPPPQQLAGRTISYAAGEEPGGIAVGDFDGDGLEDVVVANKESSSLSFFLQSPERVFQGQVSVPTDELPSGIDLYSKNDSALTFIVNHEAAATVSVLTLPRLGDSPTGQTFSPFTYDISTGENPRVLLPETKALDSVIEFYVYSGSRQSTLSYFRQVSGARFIERNFKPIIPFRVLAGAVDDFNGDGFPDIAYVSLDQDSMHYNLSITFSDSADQYRGKLRSYVLPDSTIKRCYLFFADLNGDNIPDCIIYTAPANVVRCALGKGGGMFNEFVTVSQDVKISRQDHLKIFDWDGDGVPDIEIENDATSELLVYKGIGNGHFFSGEPVVKLPRAAAFGFGDFNSDSKMDVVFSDPDRNVVCVYFGSK
jgi:FG-GAP-like repeat